MPPVNPIKVADGQCAWGPMVRRGNASNDFHDKLSIILSSMKSIVILISGRGSNMEAIVRACQAEAWGATIAAVIANRPAASGLEFARQAGITALAVDHKNYASRDEFDAALMREIDRFNPDLLVLAGFMRILTPAFVNHYAGRLLNIHPSLLPAFPGVHTHQQALDAGVNRHGATVHFVTEQLDHGPIVIQASVPVYPEDDEETLAARVLVQEHQIYPRAIRWFIEDRLKIVGDQVVVRPTEIQMIHTESK